MGSWAMCSPQGSGNGLSLEVRVSSALCRWWGLKTLFRVCEQWPLPDWAVNHLVPANTVPTSWSYELTQGSPGAQAVKNLWQCRRLRIDPWVGYIPWRREWQPTAAVLTRESHGQRSLLGYSPWKHREGHNWGLNHIKKQSHYFVNRGPSSQGYGFSSGRVWMWELDYKESWVSKNWCFWTVVLEKTLESPLVCRRSNQSVLKEISPEYLFMEGLMLKLKLQYFGYLMRRADSFEKTLMLGKIEVRRRRGWQRMRWLDGITDSMEMSKLREIVEDTETWRDRDAWRAAVHGVTKSRTWRRDWTELNWCNLHS